MRFLPCSLCLLTVAAAASPVEVAPAAWPEARYAPMLEESPFSLATAAEAPKIDEKTFADGWHVKALYQIPEDGKLVDQVVIKSSDAKQDFTLEGKNEHEGVSIASIEWSSVLAGSIVTLKKGTEFARVEFDEAEKHGAPPPPPGNPHPGQAGGLAPGTGGPRNPMGRPAGTPRPPIGTAIPAPTGPPNGNVRARARFIPSPAGS